MFEKIKSIFSSGPRTAAAILGLIVVWMMLGIFSGPGEEKIADTGASAGKLNEVLVKQLQAQAVNREISILGETRYNRKVTINALTEGTVVRIKSKEGKIVLAGESIVTIDDREAQAQLIHAQSLERQKQLEFDGYQSLFEQELISEAKLAEARASLENAKAQRIQKQIRFQGTKVIAPYEGLLQKVHVEEGDYVAVGDKLAEILDFSPFIVVGEVPEKEAVYIQQGMNADAKLIDGTIFHGVINYKSAMADPSSRSFEVELLIENTEQQNILSGISSTITIPVTHNKAHLVATSALEIDDQGKFGVKVINEDNVVSFFPVEVLESNQQGVWVSGLPDIARVIIRGQGFVKPGDIVKPVYQDDQQSEIQSATTDKNQNS